MYIRFLVFAVSRNNSSRDCEKTDGEAVVFAGRRDSGDRALRDGVEVVRRNEQSSSASLGFLLLLETELRRGNTALETLRRAEQHSRECVDKARLRRSAGRRLEIGSNSVQTLLQFGTNGSSLSRKRKCTVFLIVLA